MGRHLSQLMNLNRYTGQDYVADLDGSRPNELYSGFNYRANNLNSEYNAMVTKSRSASPTACSSSSVSCGRN